MPTNALIGANNNNILTKKNNIIVNGQESQQQPITIDEEGEDNNDDVQIVDDEEGEEGECSPFCKNCASEIPLIIKYEIFQNRIKHKIGCDLIIKISI